MLDGCKFKALSVRLSEGYNYGHAALTLKGGDKAIVCFDDELKMRCEQFDGSKVTWVLSMTNVPHWHGGLALYYGRPATVGGIHAQGSAETLRKIWLPVSSHPRLSRYHSLVKLIPELQMDYDYFFSWTYVRKLADDWRV